MSTVVGFEAVLIYESRVKLLYSRSFKFNKVLCFYWSLQLVNKCIIVALETDSTLKLKFGVI